MIFCDVSNNSNPGFNSWGATESLIPEGLDPGCLPLPLTSSSPGIVCTANSIQCPVGGGLCCGKDVISSPYQNDHLHSTLDALLDHIGIDFTIPVDTPLLTVTDEVIEVAQLSSLLGNMVILCYGGSTSDISQNGFRYDHTDRVDINEGDEFKAVDQIGLSGNI